MIQKQKWCNIQKCSESLQISIRFWKFSNDLQNSWKLEFIYFCRCLFIKSLLSKISKIQYDLNNTMFYLRTNKFENQFSQFRFVDVFTSLLCSFCHIIMFLVTTPLKIVQIMYWNSRMLFERVKRKRRKMFEQIQPFFFS